MVHALAQLPLEELDSHKTGTEMNATTVTAFDNPDHPFSNLPVAPQDCGAGYNNAHVTLHVDFNTGADHELGVVQFTAHFKFNLVTVDQHHNVIASTHHELKVDANNPEAVYQVDLVADFDDISEVRIDADPGLVNDNPTVVSATRFHADFSLEIDRRIGKPQYGAQVQGPTGLGTSTNNVHFSWFWTPYAAGCQHEYPRYQLQVLRLYERGTSTDVKVLNKAVVDWSQAATFDLETSQRFSDLILAEGTGFYVWRVRPITNWYSDNPADPRNWGPWSSEGPFTQGATVQNISTAGPTSFGLGMGTGPVQSQSHEVFFYQQFDEDRNWIYARTFTEGSASDDVPLSISEKMTYATQLQQVEQEQTCLHEDNNTLASQTVSDLSGRPAIKSLPVPITGQSSIGFVPDLMSPTGSSGNFTATNFDVTPNSDPALDPFTGHHYFQYYSPDNTDTEVPDAKNYPYVHTRFHPDGRAKESNAPGQEFAFNASITPPVNYHVPTTDYAGVTQDELTRVFGDQSYDPETVHEVINTDANGVTSISYQDKEGHVLATSLVKGGATNDLAPLNSPQSTPYSVTGSVGGDIPTGVYTEEASAVFHVEALQQVSFHYRITPSSIHDACGNYCATCDASVDFFLLNEDLPSANLIPESNRHKIYPNSTPGPNCQAAEETYDFQVELGPGTYELRRRITTNNWYNDPVNDVTYLEQDVAEDLGQLQSTIDGQVGNTIALLQAANPDLAAVYATGTVTGGNDPQVSWPIGCTTLTMPEAQCAPCSDTPDSLMASFGRQFGEMATYWNAANPNATQFPVVPTDAELLSRMVIHGQTYTAIEFSGLIQNLEQLHTCEEITQCWMGACASYLAAVESGNVDIDLSTVDFSELPSGGTGISGTVHVELMDFFINCIGRNITRESTSLQDYLTHPYEASFYHPGDSPDCVSAVNAAYDPDATNSSTWGTILTLHTDNGDVTTTGWQLFDGCVASMQNVAFSSGTPNTLDMLEQQLAGLEDVCFDACYTKRDAFADAVAQLLALPVTDQEVQCTTNALLAKCYTDCEGVSVQYDQGLPTGLGPMSALARIQLIIAGHFGLAQPLGGNPCAAPYEPVNTSNIDVPLTNMYPSEQQLVDQLNNAMDHLGPFMLQHDFQDYGGWHLVEDPLHGDILVWSHPEVCMTLSVRLGKLSAPPNSLHQCLNEAYNVGDFYSAASVQCGPNDDYDIHQVELFIGNTRVFGALFGDAFMSLQTIYAALGGDHSFTTTYGKFTLPTGGIDFVKANGSAWPTNDYPVFNPQGGAALNVELLHGNAHAGTVTTTLSLILLQNAYCRYKQDHACDGVCIAWYPGWNIPEGDHFDLPSCETVIAENYLLAIQQRIADVRGQAQADLDAQYAQNCASPAGIADNLSYTYTKAQYQYTLYYYDRAGNLINTVAPNQVRTMEQDGVTDHSQWPTHHLDQHQRTTYVHNSLGQVVQQTTPNGGITNIYLDQLGRPRIAQDAQQAVENSYTYTKYDALGRVVETGRANQVPIGYTSFNNFKTATYQDRAVFFLSYPDFPTQLPSDGLAYRTITTYTTDAGAHYINGSGQRFLQNRVSCARTDEDGNLSTTDDQVSTYYSYDPHGNVEWIVQQIPGLGLSYVGYDYDLVSGRVREVHYNEGRVDQFFQRYAYDADGRILRAETSTDGVIWDKDASYAYYKHGPLKRTLVGEDEVQGTDHTYTLQGWLKGINDPRLQGADAGRDGVTGQPNVKVARDAFGMVLGYYSGDFDRSGSAFASQENIRLSKKLYNGNISGWGFTSQLSQAESVPFATDAPLAFAYQYDELNRLLVSAALKWTTNWVTMGNKWGTTHSYDANGNIVNTKRYDQSGTLADNIGYTMPNQFTIAVPPDQLSAITESHDNNSGDLKENHTYHYYVNGELKEDVAASLDVKVLQWDPSAKVRHIHSGTEHLRFLYDASGQRVAKAVLAHGTDTDQSFKQTVTDGDEYTYYVRDAQGNILGTYVRHILATTDPNDGNTLDDYVNLSEEAIYGSARLGMRLGDATKMHEVIWVNGQPTAPPFPYHVTSEVGGLLIGQLDAVHPTLYEHHTVPGSPITMAGDDKVNNVLGCADLYSAEDEQQNTLFSARTVLDANDRTSHLYLHDTNGDPMYGSDGLKCDWRSGTLSARVPGKTDQYYLFTIGADALPYVNIVDMSATTITDGEVISPTNTVLDNNARHTYTGAMAVLDDRSGNGVPWLYLKYVDTSSGLTHLEGVDLSALANGARPEDYLHDLASFTALDNTFSYDEIQLSPDLHYLAVADRLKPDIWADHNITLYTLSADHAQLTLASQYLAKATNISSLDFSPNGTYLYFVGSASSGNYAFRIATTDMAHATPKLILKDAGDVRRTSDQNMLVTTPTALWRVTNPEGTTPVNTLIANASQWHSGMNFISNVALQPTVLKGPITPNGTYARALGNKRYELTDHLGNVRVVVTDRKLSTYSKASDAASNFRAEVTSRTDYYPFGSLMPGRNYSSSNYRFGFNGKENDNQVFNATGTFQDYGMRMYDPRLGRFPSLDPLTAKYPWYTPYQFAGNNPIKYIDIDGAEQGEILPGTSVLIIVAQGWANSSPDDGATQANNAATTNPSAGPDGGLGTLPYRVGGPFTQTFVYASSLRKNTAQDIAATVAAFRKINPKGKVILVGHSLGAQNIMEALQILKNDKIQVNLSIFVDISNKQKRSIIGHGPQFAIKTVPNGSSKQVLNYFQEDGGDINYDGADGANIPLFGNIIGIDHQTIDNTITPDIADDINNCIMNIDPIKNAVRRNYSDVPLRPNINAGGGGGGSIGTY